MGDHLSRPAVAGRLERCTRFLGGPRHRNLLHLAPDGVWLAAVSPRRWWALTPPFHPYCRRLRRVCRRKRSPFCATFRRLSPPGVSPASCPSVSGLSSDRCLFPARGHPACTLIVAGARGKTRAPARSRFTRQGVGAAARAGDPPRVAISGATRARPPLRAGRRPAPAVSRPERGAGASRLLSFVVVCAAPRPRCAAAGTSRAALPRRVGQQRAGEIVHATRLRFVPGSASAVLRGGALEPRILASIDKRQAKAAAYCAAGINPCRIGWELFSLRRGLECSYVVFKPGITSWLIHSPPKRRRRPFGSPSIRWLCG